MRLPAVNVAGIDPIIIAIKSFRDGLAAFNAAPPCDTPEGNSIKAAQTYGPAQDALLNWAQPAQTHAGAVEAIRLAAEENADYSGSEIAENMVRAALAYFDAQPADVPKRQPCR